MARKLSDEEKILSRGIHADMFMQVIGVHLFYRPPMRDFPESAFAGMSEHGEGLLEGWVQTGRFPEVHGVWIVFEEKFADYIQSVSPHLWEE